MSAEGSPKGDEAEPYRLNISGEHMGSWSEEGFQAGCITRGQILRFAAERRIAERVYQPSIFPEPRWRMRTLS